MRSIFPNVPRVADDPAIIDKIRYQAASIYDREAYGYEVENFTDSEAFLERRYKAFVQAAQNLGYAEYLAKFKPTSPLSSGAGVPYISEKRQPQPQPIFRPTPRPSYSKRQRPTYKVQPPQEPRPQSSSSKLIAFNSKQVIASGSWPHQHQTPTQATPQQFRSSTPRPSYVRVPRKPQPYKAQPVAQPPKKLSAGNTLNHLMGVYK